MTTTTTVLDAASWGPCCSCTVKLVSDVGQGWDFSWHGYLVVECPEGVHHIQVCPNDWTSPLSCDVIVKAGPPQLVKNPKIWKTCTTNCDNARRYLAAWDKLGSGGFYFPIAGSWWWPKFAMEAICGDPLEYH